MAYGSARTCRVCCRTTPAIMAASFGSAFAKGKYGMTWFAESRSHIASMSPVMMNVDDAPLLLVELLRTVVSSVFGSALRTRHASSGSLVICRLSLARRVSTAGDTNARSMGGGRRSMHGGGGDAPPDDDGSIGYPCTRARQAANATMICRCGSGCADGLRRFSFHTRTQTTQTRHTCM